MFLHLAVSHFVHKGLGVSASVYAGIHTPPPGADTHPPGCRHPSQSRNPLEADTPWEQTPPRSRQPPCAVHAGRYGQQAGSTHPTGMHTCYENVNRLELPFLLGTLSSLLCRRRGHLIKIKEFRNRLLSTRKGPACAPAE